MVVSKVKKIILSRDQVALLRGMVEQKFDNHEHFAQALENAAEKRGYQCPYIYAVNYRKHLIGHPVGLRSATVYFDVFEQDERLDFLKSLVDGI